MGLSTTFSAIFKTLEQRVRGDIFYGVNHFYDDSITPPEWTKEMKFLGKIDSFYFYSDFHLAEKPDLVSK